MGSVVRVRQGFKKARKRQAKGTPSPFSKMGRRKQIFRPMPELKFFDTVVSFTMDQTLEVPATGQWTLIPQGDGPSARDGRSVRITSVQFRGIVFASAAASAVSGTMWVILDRQANGAAAAVADVFDQSASAGAAVLCHRNLNNNRRFQILHKEVLTPTVESGATGTGLTTVGYKIEFFKKVNILVDWNSTTGAITEITQNNIFIICGSSITDDVWTVSGTARLRFVG